VPFKDYIKNVASHEILPTWNEAALYANIYCHISFILNRVYTVWYRSRGYNFDITNSTTTDQYYVYGGTVFDNISNIVDEIFNIYAKREGHREPYFTEYCDGRTVHCPGLWQWGSDALAQAGYTPIQILHYYYPDDLRLAEATEYTDTNETYPGYVLTQGSSGLEVRIMQDYLNRISANYPLIPKITDSPGYYGASTTAAVKVFEQAFGLRVTGDISKGVWYEITRTYVAVKRLGDLTGEGEFIGIDKTPPTTTIRLGSKGEDTARLQFILNYISEYYANIPGVIEDATFGQTTENAVKAFQSYFNVTPADGIVGPTTWKKLFDVYWAIYNSTPSTDAPAYPGTVLKIGSKNESVRLMQQYLNKIGETYPSIPKLVVDGQFGTGTYNAVVAFQKLFGLTPDGIIGKNTWDKIVYQYNYDAPSDAYTPGYPGYLLKLGGSGEYVTVLQDHLDAISKSYPSIPAVSIDGKFGAGTQSAVIEFQKLFNLTPDGVVGEQTWNKMAQVYLGLPKYAPPYPGIVIRQDSRGQDVLTIQEEINAISNVYPSVPKVSEDGIFGAGTKNAVAAFQSQFGLSSDGIVGKTTWNKLASVYNVIGGGGVRLTTVSKADDITPNSTIPSGAETTVKNQSVREAPNNAALLLAMRLFMR
jgi:peptidoglycan hydrolase-like protein with peptidoglycan-binding domain